MGRRTLAGCLVAVALTGFAPVPAAAAPPREEAVRASMMFVLDASGSMTARLPSGETRMDAAKAAMSTLIDRLPVNLHVGLAVYGTSTGSSPEEKAAGCRDVRVLQPVGRVDKDAMRAHVAAITPGGYTPIALALRQAEEALPDTGARSIVLVSDGIDSCAPPPPCAVARELDGAGMDLAVHTVGFRTGRKAREQLECVASATGGNYHDAPDAETLADLLPEIAERARRYYVTDGRSAAGSATLEEAEYLAPGQYTDTVPRGEPTYYQVHVPEGATGHFAVVHVVDEGHARWDSGVDLRLVDAAKRTCVEHRGFREFSYDGPETAAVSWTAEERARCDPDGPHFLEVTWDNALSSPEDGIELLVDVEPGVAGASGSPRAPVEFAEPGGGREIVWGGGSFNDAATLPGSGRYVDRLKYSEYSLYRVWLDWGQALAYRVTFLDGAAEGRATVATELRGPTRAGHRDEWWKSSDLRGSPETLGPIATPLVAYANRTGDYPAAAMAGWYYVIVKLSPVWTDHARVPEAQPAFEIALSISGEPTAGPRYDELSMPSSAPSVPNRMAGEDTAEPGAVTPPALAAESGSFPWWLVAGTGGVVLLAMVSLVLLRWRKAPARNGTWPPSA